MENNRLEAHLGAMVREACKQLRAFGSTAHASKLANAFIAVAPKPALEEYCNLPGLDDYHRQVAANAPAYVDPDGNPHY